MKSFLLAGPYCYNESITGILPLRRVEFCILPGIWEKVPSTAVRSAIFPLETGGNQISHLAVNISMVQV